METMRKTIDPVMAIVGGWTRFKALQNVKSMGYDVTYRYRIKGYGIVDVLGRRQTVNGYQHFLVKVLKTDYNMIFKPDFIKAVKKFAKFHAFDPHAELRIAFPAGSIELDAELLEVLEYYNIKPMQLSPPEHPVGGEQFFNATIQGPH